MIGTVIVAVLSGFVGYSAWLLQAYTSHRRQIREVTAALLFEAETNRLFARQLLEHGHPGNYLRDEAWVTTKNSGRAVYKASWSNSCRGADIRRASPTEPPHRVRSRF